jgi:hypothetical protein
VIIAAALLAIFVVYQYRKQAVLDRSWRWIRREESPFAFWTIIVGQMLIAAFVTGQWVHDVLQP